MMHTVLGRYLMREAASSWAAVMLVLLLIMLASRSIRFLSAAAEGKIPADLVVKVVLLSGLQYLMIIAPISLLLGLMLALGRMYKDQEISAATACGVGLARLTGPFFVLGVLAAVATGALALDLGPRAGRMVDLLVQKAGTEMAYAPFESGAFTALGDGDAVFYAEQAEEGGARFETVFIRGDSPDFRGVVLARRGVQQLVGSGGTREIRLEEGVAYQSGAGVNGRDAAEGRLDWDIFRFAALTLRLQPPDLIYSPSKTKIESTPDLLERGDPEAMAEIHWRLAAPIAVLLMVVIAVPLSHISPRQGRYSKIVYGLLVYLVYVNLLGAGQAALARGTLPLGLGLWWVHALALAFGVWLFWRRSRGVR